MDFNFERILQENHGKEITLYTNTGHHYQGQLVGCQCAKNHYQCSHLIMLLFGNYVDVPVEDILDVKVPLENELVR